MWLCEVSCPELRMDTVLPTLTSNHGVSHHVKTQQAMTRPGIAMLTMSKATSNWHLELHNLHPLDGW